MAIPAFGHFRVPVYQELDALIGGGLSVIYSASRTGETRGSALKTVLGHAGNRPYGEVVSSLGGDATTLLPNRGLCRCRSSGDCFARSSAPSRIAWSREGFFEWHPGGPGREVQEAYSARDRVRADRAHRAACRQSAHLIPQGPGARAWTRWPPTAACPANTARQSSGSLANGPSSGPWLPIPGTCNGLEKAGPAPEIDGLPRPRFLFAGRLVVLKGVAELLDGWSRAAAVRPDLGSLAIVGDGPERARLEALVSARALGNVRFIRGVDYTRMPGFYAGCDALVMPTLEDNWSLVVPEAMAGGKAVLCSVYNGCWPELVREGENGWLFDPRDPDSTARALLAASDARGQLIAMGLASRLIVGDYTPCRAAEAILKACEIAIDHYQGRAG